MSERTSRLSSVRGDVTDALQWRRLSVRVVWLDLVRVAMSAVPGYFGAFFYDEPVWPLLAASALGMLGALADFRRWATTRFRVSPDRVELHSGWLVRRYRHVPRDRIRSVDTSARLRHRLFGIRVVHIGSGAGSSSFALDAVSTELAERLQRELMPHAPAAEAAQAPAAEVADAEADQTAGPAERPAPPETLIARLRPRWVVYNAITIWAVLAVAAPLFAAYWLLRPFGVDLLDIAGRLVDGSGLGLVGAVAVGVGLAFPVGVALTGIGFVLENWNFRLVRTGVPPGTALVTRRGLLKTQTVYREDRRLRGLRLTEPLLWRWLGLAETSVITTGLRGTAGGEPASGILPRIPRREALSLAARVLPDGRAPLETPLRRHPRGALNRRLLWAAAGPLAAAGLLAWFGGTGALPDWAWLVPLGLLPVTLALAVVAYRSLGHAYAADYLVVRKGAVNRATVTLHRGAVIGWTLRQSVLQRWGGRMSVGIATAAGDRYYEAPDAGVDQALALVTAATPELAGKIVD